MQIFIVIFKLPTHRGSHLGDNYQETRTVFQAFVLAKDREEAESKASIIADNNRFHQSIKPEIYAEGELMELGELFA